MNYSVDVLNANCINSVDLVKEVFGDYLKVFIRRGRVLSVSAINCVGSVNLIIKIKNENINEMIIHSFIADNEDVNKKLSEKYIGKRLVLSNKDVVDGK